VVIRTKGVGVRVLGGSLQEVAFQRQLVDRRNDVGTLSRAEVLQRGAAAVALLSGASLLRAAPAYAHWQADPLPIPGGFDENFNLVPKDPFIHVMPPAIGFDMSTITDFRGVVAAADIQGKALGSDGTHYEFDADMRFMRGVYVARDGGTRRGGFGFI
jgi:hypothetical protein